VRGQQPVDDAVRVSGVQRRDGGERYELRAPQLVERLIDGRHLGVGRAVAAAVAGEVLGDGGDASAGSPVHAADVGAAQGADPRRVAAK